MITVPTVLYVGGDATFASDSAGLCTAVTVAVAWFESTGAPLNVVDAVATLVIEPASMSACVIVCVDVHVLVAPAASAPVGQATVPCSSSLIVNGPGSENVDVFVMVYV